MTAFISRLHADLRQSRTTGRGATHTPDQVPQGLHKEYARMEKIFLPNVEPIHDSLSAVLGKRVSYFPSSKPTQLLSLQKCSNLLGNALKRKTPEKPNRNYPSGGALYPIETYFISIALESSTPYVFHYNPTLHALEKLWALPKNTDLKKFSRLPADLLFSSIVVFTSVWKRSSAKYGDFTYPLALLEAGHMSENILLVSAALNILSRPMAGFDDDAIIELLDLVPEEEQPVHIIVLDH